jgi:peptide/histidine transporter 3/4
MVIGAIYLALLSGFGVLGFLVQRTEHGIHKFVIPVYTVVAAYAFLALILLLYPVSGYIADIHCGRYKAVTLSFLLIWIAMLFLCAAGVGGMITDFSKKPGLSIAIPLGLCIALSLLLFIVSLACYQSNIVQLGMDQLLEASSDKLALFLHWLMWSYYLGRLLTLLTVVFLPCYAQVTPTKLTHILASSPFLCLVFITLLMAFTCYYHSWFYSEPGQNNPYKTVFRIIKFAMKNKNPIRRSAFTFCDDFKPSRIDFAKERYGGPFTTPQVEDVKTFLRIVIVLLALGPVFALEIPGSYYLFPLFALHVGDEIQFIKKQRCHSLAKWVLLQSTSLGYIASVFILPIYIWIVFSLFRKRIPKIFNRLWCAFIVSLSGAASLLITDLIAIGHFHHHHQQHFDVNNSTENACLFTSKFLYPKYNDTLPVVLDLHWGVTVAPIIMLSTGSLLIHATTFEFISAQSPHSMKGLLVGVFFAIKGVFQFISAVAVVPFAIPRIWNSITSVPNCGFGYYVFILVVGMIGLVAFSIVVKSYKYRQRDERPFDTRFAEQYYERYIGTSHNPAARVCSPSDENGHPALEELLYTASSDSTNSGRQD